MQIKRMTAEYVKELVEVDQIAFKREKPRSQENLGALRYQILRVVLSC